MNPLLQRKGALPLALLGAGAALMFALCTVLMWHQIAGVLANLLAGQEVWWSPVLVALLAWLGRSLTVFLRDQTTFPLAQQIRHRWRTELLQGLRQNTADQQEGQKLGRTLSVLDEGLDTVSTFYHRFLPTAAGAPVLAAVVLLAVFWQDWVSGLILLVTAPIVVTFMVLIGFAAQEVQEKQFGQLQDLNQSFLRIMGNLPVIRAFGWQNQQLALLEQHNANLRTSTMKVLRVAFLSGFVLELGATLGTALVAVTVGVRLYEGHIPYFPALLVLVLTPEYFLALRNLGAEHHAFMEARAVLPKVLALESPSAQQPAGTGALQEPPALLFDRVQVGRGGEILFQDLTFRVPAGGAVVLTGPSGVGKTTVLTLLLGLRAPQSGAVQVGGLDPQQIAVEDLKTRVAYLSQHPVFLTGTVRDNLLAAHPAATNREMEQALQQTCLWSLLQSRQGLDTEVSEGGLNFSAGERARLALARLFLKPATLLLLDEPTAHHDALTEQDLLPILWQLAEGKTTVLVSHRATTHLPGALVVPLQREKIHV